MNSGHIKFFSAIKEIKINSMIKDISSIFSQQDPFCVVKNTLALFECFEVYEGKNRTNLLVNMHIHQRYFRTHPVRIEKPISKSMNLKFIRCFSVYKLF